MAAETTPATRHRPRSMTVFAAAFVAGAVAAVGVNRALDVHLAQAKPQVECEPIFVALRSLPQGVPVTVWDVALRDWPKAMLPDTAMRVTDSFEGCLLKYPLREGQPLLSVQLGEPVAQRQPVAPATPEVTPSDEPETIVEEAFIPPAPARKAAAVETAAAPPVEEPVRQPAAEPVGLPVAEPEADVIAVEQAAVEPEQPAVEEEPVAVAEVAPPAAEPALVTAGVTPIDIPPTNTDVAVDDGEESSLADDVPTTAVAVDAADPGADTGADEDEPVAAGSANLQPIAAAPVAADGGADAEASAEPEQLATAAPAPPVANEPTLAAPLPAETPRQPTLAEMTRQRFGNRRPAPQPAPASNTDIGQILGSGTFQSVNDVPSRQAPDLADLPSVMARSTDPALPAADENGDPVRYLVVPERIARQADTSFAAPLAPAAALPASGPSQPRGRLGPQQNGQPAAAAGNSGPGRSADNRSRPSQQVAPAAGDRQAASSPRAWGGMFPNVSAGLEAIGRWRNRGRDDVANEQPPASQPRR